MQKQIRKTNLWFGAALLALVLAAAVGIMPASARADYNSYATVYPNGYVVYPNGYYYYQYQPTAPTNYAYNYNYQYQYPSLSASCYPANTTSIPAGSSVQWSAYATGGNGAYSYSWTGTDGLVGSGQTISTTYYNVGTKSASVTIYSAGQSITVACNSSVNVYGNNYQYTNYNNYQYYQSYPQLAVSCVANTTYVSVGQPVTWSASATGGNGFYNYSWSGSDGISGTGQALYYTYTNTGSKIAYVTVNSNGMTLTQPCQNVVSVGVPTGAVSGTTIIGQSSNNSGLDVGCYADPTTADINQPVTWSVEVTGGSSPYTYAWTGTDGLTGSAKSAITYYASAGDKSAIVTVTSADGRTTTKACSNAVKVGRVSTGAAVQTQSSGTSQPTAKPAQTTNNVQSAAAAFSLDNVPWGWVAVLVIIVLFSTVMYLLFNRPKI